MVARRPAKAGLAISADGSARLEPQQEAAGQREWIARGPCRSNSKTSPFMYNLYLLLGVFTAGLDSFALLDVMLVLVRLSVVCGVSDRPPSV